jgi:hypothetical protein
MAGRRLAGGDKKTLNLLLEYGVTFFVVIEELHLLESMFL